MSTKYQHNLSLEALDTPEGENQEALREFDRVFQEQYSHLCNVIANLCSKDEVHDIVQYAYLCLRHRGVEQARKMEKWVESGVRTIAVKYVQRDAARRHPTNFHQERNVLDCAAYDMSHKSTLEDDFSLVTILSKYFDYYHKAPSTPDEQVLRQENTDDEEEIKAKIQEALQELSELDQKVVREYGIGDKTCKQVAKATDLAPGSVRSRWCRAKEKLATILTHKGIHDYV